MGGGFAGIGVGVGWRFVAIGLGVNVATDLASAVIVARIPFAIAVSVVVMLDVLVRAHPEQIQQMLVKIAIVPTKTINRFMMSPLCC